MNKKLYKLMNWPNIEAVVYSDETHPFDILGSKTVGSNTLFQAFFPKASEAYLITKDEKHKMEMADELGFFAILVPGKNIKEYSYEFKVSDRIITLRDSYNFKDYFISSKENAKFQAGINYEIYKYLGSHVAKIDGVDGVRFALWAPNAVSVSVIGEFNDFTPNAHIMQKNDEFGIFELFIPDVKVNDEYQYAIKTKNGQILKKADPYGCKLNKDNGYSVVTASDYKFKNNTYKIEADKMSILEISLDAMSIESDKLIESIVSNAVDLSFTHVKLSPVMEALDDNSYSTLGFYAVSDKVGGADGLKKLIEAFHEKNIGVILEWAPFHFPSADYGMNFFDGTCLYEHLDPRKGIHPIDGSMLFNYARNEVSIYLIANALYYLKEFKADGLVLDSLSSILYLDYGRTDGEWIPNIYGGNENLEGLEFIKHLNSIVHKECPGAIMIASDDSGYPNMTVDLKDGGLGFDYKNNYNMVMDYIDYIKCDPYDRSNHHDQLCLSYLYQYKENFINSLSSRYFDVEELYNALPVDDNGKLATIRQTIAYMMVHPGCKLISNELINHIHNKGLKALIKDLNKTYIGNKALYELDEINEGFEWINCIDYNKCILSFKRNSKIDKEAIFVVCNFANVEQKLSVGTMMPGKYKEILNTDDKAYGGLGKINKKNIAVSEIGADEKDYSFEVKLAPLSLCIFKFVPFTEKEQFEIDKKKEAALAKTKASQYHEEAIALESELKNANDELKAIKDKISTIQKQLKSTNDLEEKELLKAKMALDACK